MIKVRYSPDSNSSLPDGRVRSFVDDIIGCYRQIGTATCLVSNMVVIDEFRLRLAREELTPDDIFFEVGDRVIHPSKYGVLNDWPTDVLDLNVEQVTDIVRTTSQRRMKERANNGN